MINCKLFVFFPNHCLFRFFVSTKSRCKSWQITLTPWPLVSHSPSVGQERNGDVLSEPKRFAPRAASFEANGLVEKITGIILFRVLLFYCKNGNVDGGYTCILSIYYIYIMYIYIYIHMYVHIEYNLTLKKTTILIGNCLAPWEGQRSSACAEIWGCVSWGSELTRAGSTPEGKLLTCAPKIFSLVPLTHLRPPRLTYAPKYSLAPPSRLTCATWPSTIPSSKIYLFIKTFLFI